MTETICTIPDCTEAAAIDGICGRHAAAIYTRERTRVATTLQDLIPTASPEMIQALVMQLEHLMQMLARTAVTGRRFEMQSRTEEEEAHE